MRRFIAAATALNQGYRVLASSGVATDSAPP